MDDPEVTLQEQIFHNAVREHIVSADYVELSVFYVCVFVAVPESQCHV